METIIKGIPVVLYSKVKSGVDPFNQPIYLDRKITVNNVLVAPALPDDIFQANNMYGKKLVYTLGIPKGDTNIWEDSTVEFFGEKFKVFGHVMQGIESPIPLDWNKKVMVEKYE